MIRSEMTGKRSLAFSQWIKIKLPDTETGYVVENLDWNFHNYKNKIILLAEEKTHGGYLKFAQSKIFLDIISPALKMWCENNQYKYLGFHIIRFENECPSDGKIWWDDKLITEDGLIEKLSW